MDELVAVLWTIGALILTGWIFGVAALVQARRARAEVRELRNVVARLAVLPAQPQAVPSEPQQVAPTPAPAAPDQVAEPVRVPDPRFSQPAPPRPRTDPRPRIDPRPRVDIEQLLTQRWGVWLGAAALLLAGVFLVRFAAEQGLFGPGPRCFMAAVLGTALVGGAEVLRRRQQSGGVMPSVVPGAMVDQVPSALAAGGVAAWMTAGYAAGPLYGLVGSLAAFVLMAGAACGGLALSLRFGPLVAAVGLAGAFGTPLLVGSVHPSVPGLFGYLLLVSAAAWAVVRFSAWTWLGWAAGAAGAAWVLAFALQGGPDAWAPALFVPAAAALTLALLPGAALDHPAGRRLSWAPFLLLGLAGLLLATRTGDASARMGVFLLAPAAVAKGWAEPRLARLPQLAALLFLLVLLTWALPAWQPTGETLSIEGAVQAVLPGAWAPDAILPLLETAAAMAAWFAAAGLFLERRAPRPLPWAALVAGVPVLTLGVTYAQVGRFQPVAAWAAAAVALAAALAGAAALARQEGSLQRAGVHAAGCVAALALGCAMLLGSQWLTLALSLLLPALAWIEGAAGVPMRRVAMAVAVLVLARLVLNPFVLAYDIRSWPVLNGLLAAYAVPAASFALAAGLFRRRADDLVVAVLEAGALAFTALLVVLEIHHGATSGHLRAFDPDFAETAGQVDALGLLALGVMWLHARRPRRVLAAGGRIIGGVALAGGMLLLVLNPGVTGAAVGRSPVLNALLPAYAVPVLLAVLALRMGWGPRRRMAAYVLAAAFAWTTLEVRQVFHPGALSFFDEAAGDAEVWAYSGAWLLLGAALMAGALRTGQRALRLAALGLVGLVTAKVFLWDMAGLTGLWRVLSFLGLGLSLIGLGAFYRRFVQPAPDVPA